MPRLLQLLAIGDATKDVFVDIHEASVSCSINAEACQLCLNYADKIPVQSVTQIRAAGNAANAAVGTSRLGHRTAMLSILGDDKDGHDLQEALAEEGVENRLVTFDKKHGTNYSTVLNFHGERTILVYHQPRTYIFPASIPKAAWIYYTSIGEHHLPYEKKLLQYLKQNNDVKLLFNPGTHQLRRGMASLEPIIARSDVFIVNKEEAEHILEDGVHPIPALLMRLHQAGSEIVIITDGQKGSWAYDGHEMWKLGIFPGKIVERTGAGDSYATGVINAIMDGKPLTEAMRWGTANAWRVVQEIGPQKGLLTAAEMRKTLKKFARIKAQKVSHS